MRTMCHSRTPVVGEHPVQAAFRWGALDGMTRREGAPVRDLIIVVLIPPLLILLTLLLADLERRVTTWQHRAVPPSPSAPSASGAQGDDARGAVGCWGQCSSADQAERGRHRAPKRLAPLLKNEQVPPTVVIPARH